MDVWKFIKSVFQRTNKNWKLLVVEFIANVIMVIVVILGVAIPAIMIIVPAAAGDFEVNEFLPFVFEHLPYILSSFLIFLIFLLGSFVLWGFVTGGVRGSLLTNILDGKGFELKTFMAQCRKFFGRIIGLWALTGFIYTLFFIVMGGLGSLLFLFCFRFYQVGSEAGAILTGIFSGGIILLIFFVVGFLINIFLAIATTYLIVEDAQVVDAMKGSVGFIKKYIGHTFLVVVILFVISFGVSFAYSIAVMPLTMIPYVGSFFSLLLSPIQIGLNIYVVLFSTIAYMILYLWKTKKITVDF